MENNRFKQVLNNRLEDARFWTRIMKEHALFIKLGLPCEQMDLREEAQAFYDRFEALEERVNEARRLNHSLTEELIDAVSDFIRFKQRILRMLIQCEMRANLFPLLINHLRREATHFKELLQDSEPENPFQQVLQTEIFWLRIMKEHVEFVVHLLDPSERALIEQAEDFRERFSDLLETARDLNSMAISRPECFNRVIRFTNQVIAATTELRDFKAVANELVVLCRVLSAVPTPVLTDHIRREADKFLDEAEELQALVPECDSPIPEGLSFETIVRNDTMEFQVLPENSFFATNNEFQLSRILDSLDIPVPSEINFDDNIVIGTVRHNIERLNLEERTINVVVEDKEQGYHLIEVPKEQFIEEGFYILDFMTPEGNQLDRDRVRIEF